MLSTWVQSLVRLPSRGSPGKAIHCFRAATAHLLWPWSCPLCGVTAIYDYSSRVCPDCVTAIVAERLELYCHGCGMPHACEPKADRCPACRSRPRAFAAIAVAGSHRSAIRQAILQWKFGRRPGLDLLLGDLVVDALSRQSWRDGVDGLVPIPQPWTRWLGRQCFPVGDLASRVGTLIGIPVWPILKARRHRPQVGLDMESRRRNVRGVFQVRSRMDLRGCRLCLIDDVTTTGATLEAAATALRRAGATEVYAAAIAKMGA